SGTGDGEAGDGETGDGGDGEAGDGGTGDGGTGDSGTGNSGTTSGTTTDGNSSNSSSSSSSSSNSTTTNTDTDSTFVPTITPSTSTDSGTSSTAPTTVTNTPIVAQAVAVTVVDTVVTVDEATGNTVKTTAYSSGAKVVQTVTQSGSVSAEISGITTKTEMTIPLDKAPSITEVVVIVHEDGTREIIKDTAIDGDGLRIILNSNATIEVVDNKKSFDDVATNSWYEDSVSFVTSRELFNGMEEGVFAPTGTMTRAMIWQVLYNYQGSDVGATGSEWYAEAQAWATEMGVSDGTNPDSEMTREQLVTLLYRMGGTGATTGEIDNFSDNNDVSDWASDAMNWAVGEGILVGSDGNLNPKGNASRAEVAAIMMRFISK
ncbi:MAG: S-layer homology domain-containing protein, partial [Bacillota bacterium]